MQFERIRLVDVDFFHLVSWRVACAWIRCNAISTGIPARSCSPAIRQRGQYQSRYFPSCFKTCRRPRHKARSSLLRSKVSIQVRKEIRRCLRTRMTTSIRGLRIQTRPGSRDRSPMRFDFLRDYISYTADSPYPYASTVSAYGDEALVLTNPFATRQTSRTVPSGRSMYRPRAAGCRLVAPAYSNGSFPRTKPYSSIRDPIIEHRSPGTVSAQGEKPSPRSAIGSC